MTVFVELDRMQREAVAKLRSGDHSEFLVGFLSAAVMVELSSLRESVSDLHGYAEAVASVLVQHAPIDHCRIGFDAPGLPPAEATAGLSFDTSRNGVAMRARAGSATLDADGGATARLDVEGIPVALDEAGFLRMAVTQIAEGLSSVADAERTRRAAAVEHALAVVHGFDVGWGVPALERLTEALAWLPGSCGATMVVTAPQLGGRITTSAGRAGLGPLERQFHIGQEIDVTIAVHQISMATIQQAGDLDAIVAVLRAELDRLDRAARELAEQEVDPLTHTVSRRRLGKALAMARATAERNDARMGVLLFDLDRFNRLNERLGRATGDAVLVEFARLLQRCAGRLDTVGRWSGDRFLIVCPAAEPATLAALADEVVRGCPAACAAVMPSDERQTTSVGMALYPDAARTVEALVVCADDAVAAAKRAGRNRSTLALADARR